MTAVTLFDAGDHVADTVGEQPRSIAERFTTFHAEHPEVRSLADRIVVDDATGCWLWTGSRTKGGYGRVGVGGVDVYLHRLVYEWLVAPIPSGLEIDHLCNVRECCRPEHLEAVTHAENCRRMGERGRAPGQARTHCPQGHPYEGSNVYVWQGHRKCRVCMLAASARYRARRKLRS